MPRKVLLVQDDTSTTNAIREGLQAEGIESEVASNVKEALAAIQHLRPDIVVLEMLLGGGIGDGRASDCAFEQGPNPDLDLEHAWHDRAPS